MDINFLQKNIKNMNIIFGTYQFSMNIDIDFEQKLYDNM